MSTYRVSSDEEMSGNEYEEEDEEEERSSVWSPGLHEHRSRSPATTAAGVASVNRSQTQDAWKTEDDPDTANPGPPTFLPKRTPGVQPPLTTGKQTPGAIFSQFFDAEVLKILCENTNSFAQKKKETGKPFPWKDLTPQELTKYLGLLLYMSVCNFPRITDYWRKNSIFHVSYPAAVMSRDRFLTISSHLHFSDPDVDAVNEQKMGTEEYDPLQRVRCLLEMISSRCKAAYHPRQHISVGERMVATKGRLQIKEHVDADKPTKWGLNFFVLADVNGYTIDYMLHSGEKQRASGKGLAFDVVAELVNREYLGRGYIVYCDSFYTSPVLFRHLIQQGFGACGMYKQGRTGVPTTKLNALNRKSKRGSIRWIRDGDLLYVRWMDTREMSLCTTVHPVHGGETVVRWQKTEDGRSQRAPLPRPTAVSEFNKYMGGVDTSGQMLTTNSVHRKTRRWDVTVFQHLLDIAVTNSYIIQKELSSALEQKPLSRQDFQEQLCAELLGVPLAEPPQTTGDGHFPCPTSKGRDIETSQRASKGRKQCYFCKRSTPWMCEKCGIGLCLHLYGQNLAGNTNLFIIHTISSCRT
uniref:PiggyBac transposable element-derived protein domain-containing protein n=1 Tax=Oryzias sinensis TaxID=183150 RepID=A0A8C7X1T9_9TELE